MQMSDDTHEGPEDTGIPDAGYYGIWPTLGGMAFGLGLIWFMFALANGFA